MKYLRGFSLIEVVVSGAMVATTVGALFAVASMTIRLTLQGQDRILASQLAREGLEIARQIRDVNFVSSDCNASSNPCPVWHTGLLNTGQQPPVIKGIDSQRNVGFTLVNANLNQESCADYIVRNLTTGAIVITHTRPNNPGTRTQIFCRRIYLEPVTLPAIGFPKVTIDQSQRIKALRIRSQIAWLGYGRNSFRQPGNPTANNECPTSSTEWCIDQVTVLTDWRPKL